MTYAKKEFKVIDTHSGSGNSAIAADEFGIEEYVGCEIDPFYHGKSKQRFSLLTPQQSLFKQAS